MKKYGIPVVVGLLVVAGLLVWYFMREAKEEGPVTIQVINQSRWSQTIEQAVQQWNEEHPNRPVVLDQLIIGYPQLRNKLLTATGAERPPDVSILDSVWLSEFAQAGQLAALDEADPEWYENDYKKDFFPVFQQGDIFGGHLWGVRTQTDMAVLWYRKDWLSQEKMAAPETWSDLVRVAQHFQKENVQARYENSEFPLAMPLGQKARETLVYQLLPLFWSNGGDVIGDGELLLDSKRNVETLQFLKDLVDVHGIVSPEATVFEWNRAMKLFGTGKAVMAFGGTYEKRMIQEVSGWDDQEFRTRAGYALIPAGTGGEPSTTAGGMCYVVYERSPHKELAMEIVKRATSPPIMKKFLLETYQHPPRISIAESLDETDHPFLAETAKYLYMAKTRPNFPAYSRLSDALQEMIELTVRGTLEPSEAVARTAEKIRDLMSDEG
jgi:ABC-type glycerol-3-phosphate transport system substrate-binding protein